MMTLLVSHHLLLCATPSKGSCCQPEQGKKSWQKLKKLIKDLNLESNKRPEGVVLRSKVDCLRICKGGPILLVWPDGIWYGSVSPKRMELIIYKHIIEGNPLKEWIIKYTPLSNN
tara:strand:+ start:295 stop:639 length:345 start_codon:yes stop_codon:yes gene_type:complete